MNNKILMYEQLIQQLDALLKDEHNMIASFANASTLLFHTVPNISWSGFYIYQGGELILGPFQGRVACMHITMGKGVCGTSALQRNILCIDNVNEFPCYIACDSTSRSEIVLPIIKEDTLLGVLDIDSQTLSRFDDNDIMFLEKFVQSLVQSL